MKSLLTSCAVLGLGVMTACSSGPGSESTGDSGESAAEAIDTSAACNRTQILASVTGGRRTAIERGFHWFDTHVPYSQSRSHEGYRTDCSGFVSMCWQLGTSFSTADFSTGGGDSHKLASYDDLIPGDAIVRRSGGQGHIVLFLGWSSPTRSSACVLEQANTASDMEFHARTTSSLHSGGFKPIRADALSGSVTPDPTPDPTPTPNPTPTPDPTPPPDPGTGGVTCAGDGDCNPGNDGSGQICTGHQCVAGCRRDNQCPGTTVCVSGQCQ